jgi:catechol 2,3-dioxygenase-like lactoylglutathione lyase family enzyme
MMKPKRLVSALHHASLKVASLEEACHRWSHLLGLHGERISSHEAILRCTYEDYALRLRESEEKPSLDYVCYELAPGLKLEEARRTLMDRGQRIVDTRVPLRGDGIMLQDSDENNVVLIERVRPADTRPSEVRFSGVIPGWHPRKLGHVNFLTSDVRRQVRWYTEVLEFGVTDWIGDEGVWLHVNSEHHVLAFLEKGFNHIHHLAFDLVDWGEMRVALDHLAKNQRHQVWGPGRHGMARNLFSYFRMVEEELFVELCCDMEILSQDHEIRHFVDDPHSSNAWGILPPRTYFRFDQAAVDAEEEQAYAYGKPIPAVP